MPLQRIRGLRKALPAEAFDAPEDVGNELADGLENALDLLDVQTGKARGLAARLSKQEQAAKAAQATAALAKQEAARAQAMAQAEAQKVNRGARYVKAAGLGAVLGHFSGLGTWKGAGAATALAWFTDPDR